MTRHTTARAHMRVRMGMLLVLAMIVLATTVHAGLLPVRSVSRAAAAMGQQQKQQQERNVASDSSTKTVLLPPSSSSSSLHIDAEPVSSLPSSPSSRYPVRTVANSPGMAATNCTLGVDLATPSSQSAFECMKANGVQYAVVRVFQSNCWLDPHAVDTIHAAWAAGLVVDVYFFPSTGCVLDQQGQIDAALDHLAENNAIFNRFWIDVEAWQWWAECDANIAWLTPLLKHAHARLGVARVGFYAGHNFFTTYFCNTTMYSDMGVHLWYARWDFNASFYNFTSYGGWTDPFMKQYTSIGQCDVHTDSDFRGTADCGNHLRESWEALQQDQKKQQPQQVLPATTHAPASSTTVRRSRRRGHSHARSHELNSDEELQRSGLQAEDRADASVLQQQNAVADLELAQSHSSVAATEGNCTIGVDLATPVSQSAFQCLRETHGVQFLVVRAFQSNCYIDPRTADTIKAAWGAGLAGVDVYFFPSVGCDMSATQQFDLTIAHLKKQNANFNRMWFDVEDWEWWPESECDKNLAWFTPLYKHAVSVLGADNVGIYTLGSMWQRITCGSTAFSETPMWWASWNKVPSYANYVSFGGWSLPSMKQFTGNDHACDINLDFDYRADGKCKGR